ncbi:MAG: type II toxin-antitoxin system HicA family toxin [Caldisericum sp.]|uniref:type II toxin-antitoxin system HicA family toxin n=1 Tax=Caldisericum sp. TaxID=2499687 RepID=UPI003D1396D8
MKTPRDIGYKDLIKSLERIGYEVSRQSGGHIRLTAKIGEKTHHITIPAHNPIKIGTLNSIVNELSNVLEISKAELIEKLFG